MSREGLVEVVGDEPRELSATISLQRSGGFLVMQMGKISVVLNN